MAGESPRQRPHDHRASLSGDEADELRGYWEKLAAAGNVQVPLEKQVWGDEYGSLVDQFGIEWMVNIGPAQA
jgi:PhnB protein